MKHVILSLIIVISGFSAVYGDDKLVSFFENDLKRYAAAYNERNWETVTSMLNPGIYELMPKEAFIRQLSNLDEQGIRIGIRIGSIKKISDAVEHEGVKYHLVTYSCSITINITNDAMNIDEIGKSLTAAYGEDKVKVDVEKRTIVTSADQSMIASSPSKEEKWTYLENTPQGRQLLLHIIPAVVVNKLEGKPAEEPVKIDKPDSGQDKTPGLPAGETAPAE